MRVRIVISDSGREIELDVDDPEAFIESTQATFEDSAALLWVTDTHQNRVGIPLTKVAYIEVDTGDAKTPIGFG